MTTCRLVFRGGGKAGCSTHYKSTGSFTAQVVLLNWGGGWSQAGAVPGAPATVSHCICGPSIEKSKVH